MTAVDHAELKRVAEGAGGDAWGLNDWRPEGQILVCGGEGHSYGLFATVDDALPDVAAFIAAANPAVVLALLSEIEGLKAERDATEKRASEYFVAMREARGDAAVYKHDKLEAERQLADLRTQAPDSWRPDREAVDDAIRSAICGHDGRVMMGDFWPGIDAITDSVCAALRPQTAESGK